MARRSLRHVKKNGEASGSGLFRKGGGGGEPTEGLFQKRAGIAAGTQGDSEISILGTTGEVHSSGGPLLFC